MQQQDQQPTPQQTFLQANAAYQMGDYFEASKHSGLLKAHFPDQPPVLAINGIVFARLGIDQHAIADLERAAELTEEALTNGDDQNPARPKIIDQMIRVSVAWSNALVRLGRADEAIEVIDRALAYDPTRADAIAAKGEALAATSDRAGAQKIIDDAIAEKAEPIRLAISSARITLAGDDAPSAELISFVRDQTERIGIHACDLADALRALGDLEDRAGNYDNAFSAYRRAANLRKGKFNPEAHAKMTSVLIEQWTSEEMSKLVKPTADSSMITLLLGAPCSGVNEMGAMLDQLDSVSTVGPIEALGMVAQRNFGARAGVLRPVVPTPKGLRGKQLSDGANSYKAQVAPFIASSATRMIDTNPLNLWLAGLAAIMLPNLRVVLFRRDPKDCALDCYSADLPGMFPYAADLVHAGAYIADCNRIMDHWSAVLSDERVGCAVHTVDYSDFAKDPTANARALASALGASDADSIGNLGSSMRKSPNPKHYAKKLAILDELFDQSRASV